MAHLMAQAITHQFPNEHIEFGVGPVIDHGFYYDVEMDHRLNEADLKNIEKKMKELIKKKLPIERKVMKRDEAIKHFEDINQKLKVELISDIPADEEISFFTQGDFIDLCRGPHVENTNNLPFSFKLTHVAGAYWRGSEKNQMLQRVYAVCFSSKEELQDHLKMLEEAKRRDHRKLGKELELFHFEPVAPASPFFMPKGAFIYNELVSFMRRIYDQFGYSEVITPQILDSDLWHTSGHYAHYKENMFGIDGAGLRFTTPLPPAHHKLDLSRNVVGSPGRNLGFLHQFKQVGLNTAPTHVSSAYLISGTRNFVDFIYVNNSTLRFFNIPIGSLKKV